MEWIKDKAEKLTIGLIAYSVAIIAITIASIVNIGSVLFQRLLSLSQD
jgi:hypothetical protein